MRAGNVTGEAPKQEQSETSAARHERPSTAVGVGVAVAVGCLDAMRAGVLVAVRVGSACARAGVAPAIAACPAATVPVALPAPPVRAAGLEPSAGMAAGVPPEAVPAPLGSTVKS